jgi:hypothetical protein
MQYRKGSGAIYGSLWCWRLRGPMFLSIYVIDGPPGPSPSTSGIGPGNRRHAPAELLIFVQSALIPLAGDPDVLRM